jgi:signal transduction histidine kinase
VILSKLGCYLHARYHLRIGIASGFARRLVGQLLLLNTLDAAFWGALCWFTLDTATMTGRSLVFAVLTGIAGSSMSLLAPVLPLFVAFMFVELLVAVSKLFLMHDGNYYALGLAGILYGVTLISQARNSSWASSVAVVLRLDLADSHARLRDIEQRQTLAQERQRLMQDMHDGLGSSLVSALRVVEAGRLNKLEVAQVIMGCIDDLKLAIDSMEPVEADVLLLLATLRFRLGPRLERSGIELRWDVQNVPPLEWLNPKTALHILRILQEAFTNIIKHTHANEIRVATSVDHDWVDVTVTDNGSGFVLEDALQHSSGRGLSNQLNRAQSIGAELHWHTSTAGTCLTLRLPLQVGAISATPS